MYKEFGYEKGIKRKNLFLSYSTKGVKSCFNEYCWQLKKKHFYALITIFHPSLIIILAASRSLIDII